MTRCVAVALAILWIAVKASVAADVLPPGYLPVVFYGQTELVANSATCDPPSNHGSIGDATFSPSGYTVPAGYTLVIDHAQGEGIWGTGIILYAGVPCNDNSHATHTLVAGPIYTAQPPAGASMPSSHDEPFGPYYYAAGTVVHLRLSANWNGGPNSIYGWSVSGYLKPTP